MHGYDGILPTICTFSRLTTKCHAVRDRRYNCLDVTRREIRDNGVGEAATSGHDLLTKAARMAASGASRPCQISNARTPWCNSIDTPFAPRAPVALAARSNGVRSLP